MVLPIYVYGNPVLRKPALEISKDEPGLKDLIDNLVETMYATDGVGLAAPQIGISKKIFVIDANDMSEDDPSLNGFKKVFINPEIIEESGVKWAYNEGCLSLPTLREDVNRLSEILIRYYDEAFNEHEEQFDGLKARIIQHEYDHLTGKLFIDYLPALKRKLLTPKLKAIAAGNVEISYKIKTFKK